VGNFFTFYRAITIASLLLHETRADMACKQLSFAEQEAIFFGTFITSLRSRVGRVLYFRENSFKISFFAEKVKRLAWTRVKKIYFFLKCDGSVRTGGTFTRRCDNRENILGMRSSRVYRSFAHFFSLPTSLAFFLASGFSSKSVKKKKRAQSFKVICGISLSSSSELIN
jgi:hypothetical protein